METTSHMEQFARKGAEAQTAVDRLIKNPLQMELGIPGASDRALAKTRQRMDLAKRLARMQEEGKEIRKQMAELERDAKMLMEEAVKEKEQPFLPLDPASALVASKMLESAAAAGAAAEPLPPAEPLSEQRDALRLEVQIGNETRAVVVTSPSPKEMAEHELRQRSLAGDPMTVAEAKAKFPLHVLPPGEQPADVEKYVFANPTVPIIPGEEYGLGDVGVEIRQLEHCMKGLQVLPAAPDFSTEGVGRIGYPIQIEANEWWAVVTARNWGPGGRQGAGVPMVTYMLQPIHSPDDWADTVQTAMQRWSRNSSTAPEAIPLKGVRVRDPDDDEWIIGADDERIGIKAPREDAVQLPADPVDDFPPIYYPDAKADDENYARDWYYARAVGVDGAPLTDARFDTMMSLPTWCRHLMLDQKLNDYGVRASPDRRKIHTIPKTVGEGEILLYQDLDGKWWVSSEMKYKPHGGAASKPGPRPNAKRGDRYDTAYDALLGELADLHREATRRRSVGTDAERKAAARITEALEQFRAEAHSAFNKAIAVVKHTPAAEPKAKGTKLKDTKAKDTKDKKGATCGTCLGERKLGAFIGGLKGGLPKKLHARIQYNKDLQAADSKVMKLFHSGASVSDAIAALKKEWA